jgi:nickel-type superoxide dismutase maturation protease
MGPDAATLPSDGPGTPGGPCSRGRSVPLAGAALAVAGVATVWRLRRVEVAGGSMAPTFGPGDRLVVLGRRLGRPRWPVPGEVVAVTDPRDPSRLLVKRVAAVDRVAGTVDVRGDAADASTDSRTFGPVPLSAVVGRVVYRYAPPGRTGPGPWPREYDQP